MSATPDTPTVEQKSLAYLASRLANIAYDPVQPMAFAKAVADHVDDLREDINDAKEEQP